MRTYKLSLILLISISFCTIINAQTSYKGITIDRNKDDVSCIDVKNSNSHPCYIEVEYKIGSKEGRWLSLAVRNPIPPNSNYTLDCVGSKIYGLKITYVEIQRPDVFQNLMKGLDSFSEGWVQEKREQEQQIQEDQQQY